MISLGKMLTLSSSSTGKKGYIPASIPVFLMIYSSMCMGFYYSFNCFIPF